METKIDVSSLNQNTGTKYIELQERAAEIYNEATNASLSPTSAQRLIAQALALQVLVSLK